jgi:benzoate 4-monooxygenase
MELYCFISSLILRYDFKLADPNMTLVVDEGFLRKPRGCLMALKKREPVYA